jgi:hypothetical protein
MLLISIFILVLGMLTLGDGFGGVCERCSVILKDSVVFRGHDVILGCIGYQAICIDNATMNLFGTPGFTGSHGSRQ